MLLQTEPTDTKLGDIFARGVLATEISELVISNVFTGSPSGVLGLTASSSIEGGGLDGCASGNGVEEGPRGLERVLRFNFFSESNRSKFFPLMACESL